MKLVPDVLPQGRIDIVDICDYFDEHDETLQILRVVHGARDDAKLFEE